VPVGAGQDDSEGKACAVDHDVPLGARLAAVGRVWTDRIAPLLSASEEGRLVARCLI
jgi:hypothetical protein